VFVAAPAVGEKNRELVVGVLFCPFVLGLGKVLNLCVLLSRAPVYAVFVDVRASIDIFESPYVLVYPPMFLDFSFENCDAAR